MQKIIFDGKLVNNNGGRPKNETYAKASFENGSIKLLFISYDRDIISKGKSYNDKLYEGDTVEMFVTLDKRNRYLELEVNPEGVQYAAIVTNEGGNIKIEYIAHSPFVSRTFKIEKGWRSEWDIPLVQLDGLGFDRSNAFYNLYRQDFQKDGLHLYALSPTFQSTFHILDSFIKLEI